MDKRKQKKSKKDFPLFDIRTFADLCVRWQYLKDETGYLREHFLAGHGSPYLFKKLQDSLEELDSLEKLLAEVNRLDREAVKEYIRQRSGGGNNGNRAA